MKLLKLFLILISANQLSAQCCCGDLEFNIKMPVQKSMIPNVPSAEYFKVGYDYGSLEKHQYRSLENDKWNIKVDAGCGFESILIKMELGNETMTINFTHILGERIWNLGEMEWKAGNYEMYIPDLFDEMGYYNSREGQSFNGLEKYLYPANTIDKIDLFEKGTIHFYQSQDSLSFRMLLEKSFLKELNRSRVCELELQQWGGPANGWIPVRRYFLEGLQQGMNWEGNGKGRFRFVLIGKSEKVEYKDFVLY